MSDTYYTAERSAESRPLEGAELVLHDRQLHLRGAMILIEQSARAVGVLPETVTGMPVVEQNVATEFYTEADHDPEHLQDAVRTHNQPVNTAATSDDTQQRREEESRAAIDAVFAEMTEGLHADTEPIDLPFWRDDEIDSDKLTLV